MKDEDIDCSDIPKFSEEYLRNTEGTFTTLQTETAFLSISRDVMDYFKKTGKGYMMRLSYLVDDMLRDYVRQHQQTENVI